MIAWNTKRQLTTSGVYLTDARRSLRGHRPNRRRGLAGQHPASAILESERQFIPTVLQIGGGWGKGLAEKPGLSASIFTTRARNLLVYWLGRGALSMVPTPSSAWKAPLSPPSIKTASKDSEDEKRRLEGKSSLLPLSFPVASYLFSSRKQNGLIDCCSETVLSILTVLAIELAD